MELDIYHLHCPFNHVHPQPFKNPFVANGIVEFCGTCWFIDKELISMVNCTPEIC